MSEEIGRTSRTAQEESCVLVLKRLLTILNACILFLCLVRMLESGQEVVMVLVGYGSDVCALDCDGLLPLTHAAIHGQVSLVIFHSEQPTCKL